MIVLYKGVKIIGFQRITNDALYNLIKRVVWFTVFMGECNWQRFACVFDQKGWQVIIMQECLAWMRNSMLDKTLLITRKHF